MHFFYIWTLIGHSGTGSDYIPYGDVNGEAGYYDEYGAEWQEEGWYQDEYGEWYQDPAYATAQQQVNTCF